MRRARWIGLALLATAGILVFGTLWAIHVPIVEGERLEFGRPWAFALLVVVAVDGYRRFWRPHATRPTLWFSRVKLVREVRPGLVGSLVRLPDVCRLIALVLIALALSRPQTFSESSRTVLGIDIMIVLDVSQSMEESDLQPNRLEAGKRTIRHFLASRQGAGDRVGLVAFAKEAMLHCPLTLDYRSLGAIVDDVAIGDVPALGTAIGDALGLALASLRRASGTSKVVILLSDGDWNTAEMMDPAEARDLGASMGVRVFTVLLGQERVATEPNQYGVDPQMLQSIATETRGQFFHAGDDRELAETFESIRASLPKTFAAVLGRTPNHRFFGLFLWPAFALLLLEQLLVMTRFRRSL